MSVFGPAAKTSIDMRETETPGTFAPRTSTETRETRAAIGYETNLTPNSEPSTSATDHAADVSGF